MLLLLSLWLVDADVDVKVERNYCQHGVDELEMMMMGEHSLT